MPKTPPAAIAPKECVVCSSPIPKTRTYCDRCRRLVKNHHAEYLKKRLALQKAWSTAQQAFLCHFSHLPLEEIDRDSPFAIEFDHLIPVKASALAATASFINQLKGDLTGEEFQAALLELVKHWNGAPFDRAAVAFEYWSRVAPKEEPLPPGEPRLGMAPLPTKCVVCGRKPHRGSPYCPRCRRFIGMESDNSERLKAMLAAYDRRKHGFICHYTGIELDDKDPTSPWYMAFDRGTPGKKGDLAVAALWIAIMKEDLEREEFKRVVREQAGVFKTGKVFDKGVAEFKHWKRKRAAERLWRPEKAKKKAAA